MQYFITYCETIGDIIERTQFANTVITDSDTSSKTFQGDYTGHIIINENTLGEDHFTIRFQTIWSQNGKY